MAEPLGGKTVVLGITGSIAAYKGAEVARRLMDLGADVHVTLTQAGARFITPLTLRSLTGNPVTVDMFDEPSEWDIKHVSLAQRAAAVVVAPASANAIAKLAHGIADEFIYTVALATRAPLFVAPAMNDRMYAHETVQENLARLRARGARIIEPETGRLASGAVGQGRLAEPERIAAAVAAAAAAGDLQGMRVLVTAGPTREPLDPVRFISNRSSGKMGYALAEAAAGRGAAVTLVSGPTSLPRPAGCEVVPVETTEQMYEAVLGRFPECDVFLAAAAPADYAPDAVAPQKLKKTAEPLTIELKPTADILAECGRRKKPEQLLAGFAAETENLIPSAQEKLRSKNLDMIVANDVSRGDAGIDSDWNAGYLLFRDGRNVELPVMEKSAFAQRILEAVVAERAAGEEQ
ncbi:MAG TPA: bifunctional phosphopantothenoylcysteine decarboxylase/phosphopantothenate--cysteine ligase CoaBC [Armatimonadota bacterium]|nr:bifunctional phosphopantothenoylcysteine decarboxylase/phosphopantothenate--cysteine ligase CoaBC [Armatimonadota bacterium]